MQDYINLVKEMEKGIEMGGFDKDRKAEDRNGMVVESDAMVLNIDAIDEVARILNSIDGLQDALMLQKSGKVEELMRNFGVGELVALTNKIEIRDKKHCLCILKAVRKEKVARLAACVIGNRKQELVRSAWCWLISNIKNDLDDIKVIYSYIITMRGRIKEVETLAVKLLEEVNLPGDIKLSTVTVALVNKVIKKAVDVGAVKMSTDISYGNRNKLQELANKEEDLVISWIYKYVDNLFTRMDYAYAMEDYKVEATSSVKVYIKNKKVYVGFDYLHTDLIYASDTEYKNSYADRINKTDGIEFDARDINIETLVEHGIDIAYAMRKLSKNINFTPETKYKFRNDTEAYEKFYNSYHVSLSAAKQIVEAIKKIDNCENKLDEDDIEKLIILTRGSKAVSTKRYIRNMIINNIYMPELSWLMFDFIVDTLKCQVLKNKTEKILAEYVNGYEDAINKEQVIEAFVKIMDTNKASKLDKNTLVIIATDILDKIVEIDAKQAKELLDVLKDKFGVEPQWPEIELSEAEIELRERTKGFVFDKHIVFHAVCTVCNRQLELGVETGQICCSALAQDWFITPFGAFGYIFKQKDGIEDNAIKLAANLDVWSSYDCRTGKRFVPINDEEAVKKVEIALEDCHSADDVVYKCGLGEFKGVHNELFVEVSEVDVVAGFVYRDKWTYSAELEKKFIELNKDKVIVDIKTLKPVYIPDGVDGFDIKDLFFHG